MANINPKFLPSELKILKKIGFKIDESKNYIKLNTIKKLKPINVKTGPWPGFATDCLPILIPVLTKIFGESKIKETIFTNRFMAVPELNRMGANIKIKKKLAINYRRKKMKFC